MKRAEPVENMYETTDDEDEDEYDAESDKSDSSFILLYQFMFEQSVNIYMNESNYYTLFEVIRNYKRLLLSMFQCFITKSAFLSCIRT